jgi:hypothetical protein
MRVKIGKYTNYLGPYQLAELLCFWVKDVEDEFNVKCKPEWVDNFGEWLAHGSVEPESKIGEVRAWGHERHETLLSRFLTWIHSKRKRTIKVHIDRWDTWSMDDTLGHIVLPMLKQLQETKQGSPFVDNSDVPEELRSDEIECDVSATHHLKWDWVIDEMIFAFETKCGNLSNWEDEFRTGKHDMQWKRLDDGSSELIKGPNDTSKYDTKGAKAYQERISNGFRLFGKYLESLWD